MSSPNKPASPAKVDYMQGKNRFKEMVNRKEGIRISDAIKKAEANVESYKSTGLSAIDQQIGELQTICARMKTGSTAADERKVYLLSNDVFASAATFGETELSEAAYSLCDMLGNRSENVPLVWDAVNVHISSMRLLRQSADDSEAAARQSVLEGLKKVTARMLAEASVKTA